MYGYKGTSRDSPPSQLPRHAPGIHPTHERGHVEHHHALTIGRDGDACALTVQLELDGEVAEGVDGQV